MILITITKGKIYINLQPKNKQTKNFRNIIKKNKSKIKKEFRNQKETVSKIIQSQIVGSSFYLQYENHYNK